MMEAKRTIRSYIGPGVFGWVVLGLFLLGALLCALTGRGEREVARPAPVAYDQVEDPGEEQDVFLDVIAISEAICPFSDSRFYYVAEDDGHQFHVVCLSEDELAGLENQRAYWNNSGTEPTFSRLVGRKYPIPDEVKQSFLSVFAMEGAAFDAFFGDRCLITQPAVTARKAIGHPVGFALFLLLALLTAVCQVLRLSAVWAALTRLEEQDALASAAAELLGDDVRQMNADRLRFGENFLFGWHAGLAAVWKDVLWCYGRQFPLFSLLMICTADGKRHPVFFPQQEEKALKEFTAAISAHNGSVLMDESAANRAAWERACRS